MEKHLACSSQILGMFIYLSLSQYLSFYMFNDIKLADRVIFNSYNGSHWKDFNYLNNNMPTAEQLMQCITFYQ